MAGLPCQAGTLETIPTDRHPWKLLWVLEVLGGSGELSHAFVAPVSGPLTKGWWHNLLAWIGGGWITQCTQPLP